MRQNFPNHRPQTPQCSVSAYAAQGSEQAQSSDEFWVKFATEMARIADDTKCEQIAAYDVQNVVNWTSYMVICTVFSKPQLLAVLAKMEKVAEDEFQAAKQNSLGSSPWELLDFGSVIIHVFTAEQRDFYDLEAFYGDAEPLDLPFLRKGLDDKSSDNWTTKN